MALIQGKQITGSVASASYALTASYALITSAGSGFPFSGSAIITGSLGVTGSVSILSNIDDLFLIKNLAGTTLMKVSQSGVVVFATQSTAPTGTAPNGGFYFTSSSFYIGLD